MIGRMVERREALPELLGLAGLRKRLATLVREVQKMPLGINPSAVYGEALWAAAGLGRGTAGRPVHGLLDCGNLEELLSQAGRMRQ
jgi:hypothetical protein